MLSKNKLYCIKTRRADIKLRQVDTVFLMLYVTRYNELGELHMLTVIWPLFRIWLDCTKHDQMTI